VSAPASHAPAAPASGVVHVSSVAHAAQPVALPRTIQVGGPSAPAADATHAGTPAADTVPSRIVLAPAPASGARPTAPGRDFHAGAQPPPTGTWSNRFAVEQRVEARGKAIEQQKAQLVSLERELEGAKVDAARTAQTSAQTRGRIAQSPYAPARGNSLHLDKLKEQTFHEAGRDEHTANERVRGLETAASQLRGRIASETHAVDSARTELAAHPEARWFKE
jgi:hypothetical protein